MVFTTLIQIMREKNQKFCAEHKENKEKFATIHISFRTPHNTLWNLTTIQGEMVKQSNNLTIHSNLRKLFSQLFIVLCPIMRDSGIVLLDRRRDYGTTFRSRLEKENFCFNIPLFSVSILLTEAVWRYSKQKQ